MFELSYKKNDNKLLFESIEKVSDKCINNIQNYIPIYNKFFNVRQNNWNKFNLDHKNQIKQFIRKINNSEYTVIVKDEKEGIEKEEEIFIKFSPTIDVLHYITGRYDGKFDIKIGLPTLSNSHPIEKVNEHNNCAYIDMFFNFLSGQLHSNVSFINGIRYYGSYLNKAKIEFNVFDDIDVIETSSFFHENNNRMFKLNQVVFDRYFSSFSRYKQKKRLSFRDRQTDEFELNIDDFSEDVNNLFLPNKQTQSKKDEILQLKEVTLEEGEFVEANIDNEANIDMILDSNSEEDQVYSTDDSEYEYTTEDSEDSDDVSNAEDNDEFDNNHTENTSSSTETSQETDYEIEDECDTESCSSDSVLDDDTQYIVDVYDCPNVMICLEKCQETLDSYMENNEISDEEWICILMQIVLQLCVYQKVFSFTHNDLHTNNIMYQPTELKFITYKLDNKYYKVPTYGKIYKLIDFGRSIYRFGNNILCSDCYDPKTGEASSLYNSEPYFNSDKPRIDPNPSFDLCRLGCSLYDYFINDSKKDMLDNPVFQLVREWCLDDNNRHILYKDEKSYNNIERFPGFKLYKMIARLVHNHIPKKVIRNPLFDNYCLSENTIYSQTNTECFVNIDEMQPQYIQNCKPH